MIEALGERELDIMDALWARGSATVGEIQVELEQRGIDIAYTTVQTLISRLVTKGAIARDTSDRAHHFRPQLKRDRLAKSAVRRLAGRFFEGSAAGLAISLIEEELSSDEVDRLRAIIDKHRSKES